MKGIINTIQKRPNYIKHHVLDAGRHIIAVRTKVGYFILNNVWKEVTEKDLEGIFENYYFKSYYKDFIA